MKFFRMKMGAAVLAFLLVHAPLTMLHSASSIDLARQLNDAFVQVAERVSSSVVVISVIQKETPDSATDNEEELEAIPAPWRDFHRRLRPGTPERSLGQGSGVIIRKDGYILTNRHVVDEAETINVRLRDGRRFKATLRGIDPQSDVAVIKIDAQDLPVATLADSSKVRVGEFAIAIGAPFSLDYSVTFGHVSAKGRSNIVDGFEGASMDQDFIQTDAQINPGNSGGPLVNLDGEIIGINTLIRGLRTGIGFAVPSGLARDVSDQLIAHGRFVRPWLGVAIQAIRDQPELREVLKGVEDGVLVSRIMPDGPAAKSELQASDIIVAVDGKPVGSPQDLRSALRPKPIGQPLVLNVYRKGKNLQVKVSPAEWVQATPAVARVKNTPPAPSPSKLGVSVQELTPELAGRLGANSKEGVVVTSVEKGSLAVSRLKPGDVIIEIDEQSVSNPKQFEDLVHKSDYKRGLLVQLLREKAVRFEVIKQE